MPNAMYDSGLDRNAANFAALSPLPFVERSAAVFPDLPAVVHGSGPKRIRRTWREVHTRSRQLAHALAQVGVGRGDTVAVMLPNTPEMVEAHYGVPMAGAVLNALNTRLDAASLAFMLHHGEARVLIADREFAPVLRRAIAQLHRPPLIIDVDDPMYEGTEAGLGGEPYEAFLATGAAEYVWSAPADEWDAIALNYTSGTTGNPKGVVYSHRGAYTNAVSNVLVWAMPHHPVYLWTLPMFHCNGWCFPWTVAAMAGTHVCLRLVDAAAVFDAIRTHGVTHFCGAPIVHSMLVNAPDELKRGIGHRVSAMVAAAAPPASMIEGMDRLGFELTLSTGSPRCTARRRSAPSSRRGRRWTSASAPCSMPGRACVTRWKKALRCSTRRRCSRCHGTARPSAR
jgi:fatty-acyl-CoA synthase